MSASRSLSELMARIRPDADKERMTLREVMHRIGEESFAPLILVPALLLVSPLSGIPGAPTLGALLIGLVAAQWLIGRDHVWVPDFLMRRSLATKRLNTALNWLERPAAWLDRHSRDRLSILVYPPASLIAKMCILAIVLPWPVLELLPMVTSLGASAVALMSFGLMVRDGLYVLAGFSFIGALAAFVWWLA